MQHEVIAAKDLSYSYLTVNGYTTALEQVSISVSRGQFVSIIGPVGAGKTTFCRCLTGLIPHYYAGSMEGSVKINGKKSSDYTIPELGSTVGFVFESAETQLIRMTVEEEVAFGPENLGLPVDEIERRVANSLELVGLTGLERRSPYSLSGGQKQRLAIASILSMEPEILVLDEPTSELDPQGTLDVFEIIFKLNKQLGKTIILVEQKTEPLASVTDRIVLLNRGRILDDGPPRTIFSKRTKEFVRLGIRLPEVTQVAALLDDDGSEFPITLEEGIDHFSNLLSRKLMAG